MPSAKTQGTQTTTVPTEHTLATITDAGNYLLYVDLNAMAKGDEVEIRAKIKVLTGGTTRQVFIGHYVGAQTNLVAASIPVSVAFEVIFTLNQTAGSSRSIPWEVIDMA